VERLFPFVLRSRILLVGRETLRGSKRRLHFVLITHDLSEKGRAEVLSDFAHYPVIQHYLSADLDQFFGLKRAKVIGFSKSDLARSIYAELKQHRLNPPPPTSAGDGPANEHRPSPDPAEVEPAKSLGVNDRAV
jgi:hypothetical protein